jgi:hypothetical protein
LGDSAEERWVKLEGIVQAIRHPDESRDLK